MTTDPTTDRSRALHLRDAADFLRDAHFRDGLSVQEAITALRHMADEADPMVGSLARDGFGLDEIAAMPAAPVAAPPTGQADEERARISAKLWEIAEHHIVAEWICCEPCEPGHTLCAKGHAALGMARTLLVDSDPKKAWNPAAPLLDAVLAEMAATAEPHRLALSTALGLGTSAPWDAIRERAAELAGQGGAVDRAAALREAADAITAVIEADRAYSPRRSNDRAALGGAREIVLGLIDKPRRLAAETPGPETQGEARQSCACGQDGCEYCDVDEEEPLLCPRCGNDISDYAEDDFVFRTGDERPYCSGECVIVAHRKNLPTTPAVAAEPGKENGRG